MYEIMWTDDIASVPKIETYEAVFYLFNTEIRSKYVDFMPGSTALDTIELYLIYANRGGVVPMASLTVSYTDCPVEPEVEVVSDPQYEGAGKVTFNPTNFVTVDRNKWYTFKFEGRDIDGNKIVAKYKMRYRQTIELKLFTPENTTLRNDYTVRLYDQTLINKDTGTFYTKKNNRKATVFYTDENHSVDEFTSLSWSCNIDVPDTEHSLSKAIYDESYAVIHDETNFGTPSVRPQDDTAVLTINATDTNGLIYRGIINVHYDYDVGVENTTIDLSGAIRTHYRNFRNSSYYYSKLRQEDVTNYYIVTGTDVYNNPHRMFFAVGQCIEPTWPQDRWNKGKINSLSFDMVNITLTADYDENSSGPSGIFYLLWDFTNNKWLPDIETAAANNNANCVELIYGDKTHSIACSSGEYDWNHFKTIGEVISIPAKYIK
jgi:hypothetical protein